MFGDVVDPSIKLGSQKWYTVPLSILAHVAIFAAVIIIPLMAADVLPTPPTMMAFVGRAAATAAASTSTARGRRRRQRFSRCRLRTRTRRRLRRRRKSFRKRRRSHRRPACPAASKAAFPEAPSAAWSADCLKPLRLRRPPRRPSASVATSRRPTKTKDVRPVYPPIAQSARVSGVVIIEATIGADGKVKDAKVLRSIPLLDQAALDAVKQWQFTPTLLNGVPVPVIMTVTVNFTLQ